MDRPVSDDWMLAMSTALVIKAYCCFNRNQVFLDLDPEITEKSGKIPMH